MRSAVAISILLLASSGASAQPAKAQDRVPTSPRTTLAVGPDGVLRPVNSTDQPPHIIDSHPPPGSAIPLGSNPSPKDIDHPCPGAPELDRAAARELVKRIAIEENFSADFVQSVARIESAFVSNAFSGRAYGLMQLTPATAERFKVELCDPEENVRGGVRYLRHLHQRFRNPIYILAAYNAGEQALIEGNGLPPTLETLTYIARVMDDFHGWPGVAEGRRGAEAESVNARDRALAEGPQEIRSLMSVRGTALFPGARQRSRRDAQPTAGTGPVDWKSGFVASFD